MSVFKAGDKVCVLCSKNLDKKNAKLPWHSEQIKEKNKYIEELLQEVERLNELMMEEI